jgi:hypothetical protein
MSGMDEFIANFFQTGASAPEAPSAEDAEKVAQSEFFVKVAMKNGIDLRKLNDAQVQYLWDQTFSEKTAGDTVQSKEAEFPPAAPPKDKKPEDKDDEDKAKKEFAEKKAAEAQHEEATMFGKTAAHAYVATLKKIAAEGGLDFMKEAAKKEPPPAEENKDSKEDNNPPALPVVTGREKKASAFELKAAQTALDKLAVAGANVEEATVRLNSLLHLGLPGESEKIAAINNYHDALEVRALEYAEAAGYPVTWTNK